MKYTWNNICELIKSLESPYKESLTIYLSLIDKTINLNSIPEILNDITSISPYAFTACQNLALTSLPESITSIGDSAFSGCSNLVLTSLPEGITSIGNYAFQSCTNLALTFLPENLTSIGKYAFYFCPRLRSLTFKGTPTSIGQNAFSVCSNLTTINVPWSEGQVAGAPWGATNATINYNYVGDDI